jgi:hypothetical protein
VTGSLNRMSMRLTNWRGSMSMPSPAPLLSKMSTLGASANTRTRSALSSVSSALHRGSAGVVGAGGEAGGGGGAKEGEEASVGTAEGRELAAELEGEGGAGAVGAVGADVINSSVSTSSTTEKSEAAAPLPTTVVAPNSPIPAPAAAPTPAPTPTSSQAPSSDPSVSTSAAANASASASADEDDHALFSELQIRAAPVDAAEVFPSSSSSLEVDLLLHPELWFEAFAAPVVTNYRNVTEGMAFVLDLYMHLNANESKSAISAAATAASTADTVAGAGDAMGHSFSCSLSSERAAILAEMGAHPDEAERRAVLKEKLDLCNAQLTLQWSLLIGALRRVMPKLNMALQRKYAAASKVFWRGQRLVQTKR